MKKKQLQSIKGFVFGIAFILLGFYILTFKNQPLYGKIIGWSLIIFWTALLSWATIKLISNYLKQNHEN